MRIDPVFTVVFAVALVAVGSNHSDGSGLTNRATRSAQLSQLAQTPNPPPAGQPGPESSTSAAPALPPAAPLSNPSSGTPAVVLDDQEVSTILGKSVRSSADEDMGRIVDIIVSRDGQIHAAIIDFGGLLRNRHAEDGHRLARAEFRSRRKPVQSYWNSPATKCDWRRNIGGVSPWWWLGRGAPSEPCRRARLQHQRGSTPRYGATKRRTVGGDEPPPGPQRTRSIIALWRAAAARPRHLPPKTKPRHRVEMRLLCCPIERQAARPIPGCALLTATF
jgi:PRC-barrel domain